MLKQLVKDEGGNILMAGIAGIALTVGVAFVIMGVIPIVQHQLNSSTLLGDVGDTSNFTSAEYTAFGKTITNFSTSIDLLLVAVIITLVFGAIIGAMILR